MGPSINKCDEINHCTYTKRYHFVSSDIQAIVCDLSHTCGLQLETLLDTMDCSSSRRPKRSTRRLLHSIGNCLSTVSSHPRMYSRFRSSRSARTLAPLWESTPDRRYLWWRCL